MNTTKEKIIRDYIDAYNKFDVPGMLRHLHDDIEFKNSANGVVNMELKGIEQFRAQAEQAKSFFSSRHQEITSITIANAIAEIDIKHTGTLALDLPNGMKKGEQLVMKGKSLFVFVDDQIIGLTDIS